MKKRIFSLILLTLVLTLSLTACNLGGLLNNKTERPSGLIYNSEYAPHLVFADPAIPQTTTNKVYKAIEEAIGVKPSFTTSDNADNAAGEIIFGKSQKAASVEAYRLLDMIPLEGDEIAYLIYSDGSSLAIAYHEEQVNTAMNAALDYFLSNYIKGELILTKGVAYNLAFSLHEYHEEKDKQQIADAWEALREGAGGDDVADALVEAYQALYTIYDDRAVSWFASLYDPGVGGFYHSISARDTFGYLPDCESTAKMLAFLESSGMLKTVGNNWTKVFPDEIKEQIGNFIYNLQASDGYFYHPQWPKGTITNSKRGRDLTWSTTILKDLGIKPKYSTPSGVSGEDSDDMMTSYTYMPGSLSSSASVVAVSKVVMTAVDTNEDLNVNGIPDYLESEEAFLEYLYGLNITEKSYNVGNELSSTGSQIRNYGLGEVLIEFLNEQQLVHGNGIWHKETNYYGINGLMKICGIYNSNKVAMPNADLAINAAISAITSDEDVGGVVDVYNPWVAVQRIQKNLETYGGEEGKAQVLALQQTLREAAPESVAATAAKLIQFKRPDGSYSYRTTGSVSSMQGAPAAVSGTDEGDIGGANIAISATITNMYQAMGLGSYEVPVYTYSDFLTFMDVLLSNTPVNKDVNTIEPDAPTTFDDDFYGSVPTELTVSLRGDETTLGVIDDPRPDDDGNVVEFVKRHGGGGGSSITIHNDFRLMSAPNNVFESDFCFTEVTATGSGAGDIFRIEVEYENDMAYVLCFRYVNGKIELWDSALTSGTQNCFTDLGLSAELGEWFNLRIEYYSGAHETVRTKIYFNDQLAAISDNYYSSEKAYGEVGTPQEKTNRVQLYAYNTTSFTVLFDNVNCYKTMDTYTYEEPVLNGYNADAKNENEIIYDFEDNAIPEDFVTVGTPTVSKGELSLTAGSGVTVPANLRKENAVANRTSLSFDISYLGTTLGELGYISIVEYNKTAKTMMKLYIKAVERDGEIYITLVDGKDNIAGNELGTVLIPAEEGENLKIDFYTDVDSTLIYVKGKLVAGYPNIFTGALAMTPAKAVIAASSGELIIDNLKFERDAFDYEEATKPTANTVTHTFEGKDSDDILVNEGTVVTDGADKALKLESGNEENLFTVAINNISAAINVYKAEAKIKLVSGEDGASYLVAFADSDGNAIFAIDLLVNGNKLEIHEASKAGTYVASLAEINVGTEFTLRIEYFTDNKLATVYVNGNCCAVTAILYDSTSNATPSKLCITSNGTEASMLIDDVKAEGTLGTYVQPPVQSGNAEDEADTLTFEYSSVISIPKAITASLVSEGASIKVSEAIIKGKPTKVLEATTSSGAIDKLHFATQETKYTDNYAAFEADINVKSASASTLYQIRLAESKGSDTMGFLMIIKYSGGKLTIQDAATTSSDGTSFTHVIGDFDTWFHIKIEYYTFKDASGKTDAITVVTIDDTVYVTEVHCGETPIAQIGSVDINSLKAINGTILLDNVSFIRDNRDYPGN